MYLLDVDSTPLVVDLLEGLMDLVMHCCHSVKLFFGSWRGEFEVIVEVDCSRVEAIQASIG